jgi:hypothetical protein
LKIKTSVFLGNKHPFMRSRTEKSFASRRSHCVQCTTTTCYYASTIQHCTNQSKDTVTHRETVNQHPTNKRTLHSTRKSNTQNASLTSAKRSIVSSDVTGTHPFRLRHKQNRLQYANRRTGTRRRINDPIIKLRPTAGVPVTLSRARQTV